MHVSFYDDVFISFENALGREMAGPTEIFIEFLMNASNASHSLNHHRQCSTALCVFNHTHLSAPCQASFLMCVFVLLMIAF